MITRAAAPDLDRTNLVIGRVVEGLDVVERIASLPYSKPRNDWCVVTCLVPLLVRFECLSLILQFESSIFNLNLGDLLRYDGPFFEAGKAMGDKRATVAEKGFNRPLKRVIVTASGVI